MWAENWVGSGSQSSPQLRNNLLEFMPIMELCSFGKKDPYGAIEWAANDNSMIPLISCQADMSSWLKQKYPGSSASGSRGRPGEKTSGSSGKEVSNYTSCVARIIFPAVPEYNKERTKQTRVNEKILTATFKIIFAKRQVTHMEAEIKPHYANFSCLQLYNRIIFM